MLAMVLVWGIGESRVLVLVVVVVVGKGGGRKGEGWDGHGEVAMEKR